MTVDETRIGLKRFARVVYDGANNYFISGIMERASKNGDTWYQVELCKVNPDSFRQTDSVCDNLNIIVIENILLTTAERVELYVAEYVDAIA